MDADGWISFAMAGKLRGLGLKPLGHLFYIHCMHQSAACHFNEKGLLSKNRMNSCEGRKLLFRIFRCQHHLHFQFFTDAHHISKVLNGEAFIQAKHYGWLIKF